MRIIYFFSKGERQEVRRRYVKIMSQEPREKDEAFCEITPRAIASEIQRAEGATKLVIPDTGCLDMTIYELIRLLTDKFGQQVQVQLLSPSELLCVTDRDCLKVFEALAAVQSQTLGATNLPRKKFLVPPSVVDKMRSRRMMGRRVAEIAAEFDVSKDLVYKYTKGYARPKDLKDVKKEHTGSDEEDLKNEDENRIELARFGFERYVDGEALRLVTRFLQSRELTSTASAYARDLYAFFESLAKARGGTKMEDLSSLKKEELLLYRIEIIRRHKKTYVYRKIGAIRSLFKFLYDNDFLPENLGRYLAFPAIDKTEVKSVPFSKEEIEAMLDKIKEIRAGAKRFEDQKMWDRNYLMIFMLASCGMRVSALLNIRLRHLVRLSGQMMLKLKRKGNEYYTVTLDKTTKESIEAFIARYMYDEKDLKSFLFHTTSTRKRLYRHQLNEIITALCRRSAIAQDGRSCHSFRVFFASEAGRRGIPLEKIKERMGHKDISTTSKYIKYQIDPQNFDFFADKSDGKIPA